METYKPKVEDKDVSARDTQDTASKAFWDERAAKWRPEGQPHSFFKNFLEQHRSELGTEALDIGCGRGIYLIPLAQQGFNVHGVDISENMLHLAQENAKKNGLDDKIHLANSNTRELPFPDQSMDFAISFGVLHFNDWDGINESFDQIHRVLRPGQYFMLQVRSANDNERERTKIEDTPGGFVAVSPDDPKQIKLHYFTREALISLGQQHGFDIVQGPVEDGAQDSDRPTRRRWWTVFKKKLQE